MHELELRRLAMLKYTLSTHMSYALQADSLPTELSGKIYIPTREYLKNFPVIQPIHSIPNFFQKIEKGIKHMPTQTPLQK